MCPGHKMKGLDFFFFFLKKQSKETVFSEQRSSCFVLTGGCVKTHLQLNQPRLEEAGQAVPCPSLHSSQVFPSLPDHQTLCYSMTHPPPQLLHSFYQQNSAAWPPEPGSLHHGVDTTGAKADVSVHTGRISQINTHVQTEPNSGARRTDECRVRGAWSWPAGPYAEGTGSL